MNDNIFSSESNEIQDSIFTSSAPAEELTEAPVIEPTPIISEPEPQIATPVLEEVVVPQVEPEKPKPSKKAKAEGDTVALYSTHNLHQSKYGDLTIGYNIVAKEKADFWLRSKKVRLATPEEVAKHFNK